MSLKNASVTLNFTRVGVQTSYGRYEYKERTTSGSVLEDDQRLFVDKQPEYSKCYQVVHLNESFVNHAISDLGRPDRHGNYKAFTFWRKFSEEDRLLYHIAQYVSDMRGEDYSFQIHSV